MLQQKMKPRHLQMIAVGGSIGTGLFVGSGSALSRGGPGGVLIAWIIMGAMLINVTQALGEMAILYPVSGGFYTLANRMLDPSFAFAMGWNYVFQWAVVLPLEIVGYFWVHKLTTRPLLPRPFNIGLGIQSQSLPGSPSSSSSSL